MGRHNVRVIQNFFNSLICIPLFVSPLYCDFDGTPPNQNHNAPVAVFAAASVVALRYPLGGMAMICLCLFVYLSPGTLGIAGK
jgi:hypothetical protein